MFKAYQEHFQRTRAAVLNRYTLDTLADWIVENTTLRGEKFSFKDHEYQLEILRSRAREKVVRKCSQVGISELAARVSLALANVLDHTTWIYTLPTATFAKAFTKTRVDPVVQTSDALKRTVNSTADNTDLKQFGNSFLYFKGTIGAAAAISIPADGILNDEVDFSDQQVMSTYESRLTHSSWKLKYRWSTPTVDGFGISEHFATTRRHWNMVKCSHCAHQFVPDYFKHVKVPGYDKDLKEITKDRLPHLRWREAQLLCPHCGKAPDLGPAHREWVVENNDEQHTGDGFQIQPFDAPAIVTPSDLVVASTNYDRYVDFVNFSLGLPAEDKESTLQRDELEACFLPNMQPGYFAHVMGIDMGLMCHIMVCGVGMDERLMTVHTEVVPLARLEERKLALQRQYQVLLTVQDSQPYTDMVMRMQASDPNLYGAVYTMSKDLAAYSVKKFEEQDEAGKGDRKVAAGEERIRQVNINRNKAFDALMYFIRAGHWRIRTDDNKDRILAHLTDMKRVKEFTAEKEASFVWRKSAKGNDHFHHTLLYAFVAAKMRAVGSSIILLPPIIGKFRVEQPD